MSYALRFGSYTLPVGFHPADDSLSRSVPSAKLPRAHGARVLTGYADGKVVEVRGGIIKGPFNRTDWRTRIDALKAALALGPANLYFETDRYYRDMQCRDFRLPFGETGYGRIATDISITFAGPHPHAFDTTSHVNSWSAPASGGTTPIVVAGGNAPAEPVWTVTVGGAGAQSIDLTITNNTTGDAMTLSGAVTGGDVITIDAVNKTVEIASVDKTSLFDGVFVTLDVGSNTIQYDSAAGSAAHVGTSWAERYR